MTIGSPGSTRLSQNVTALDLRGMISFLLQLIIANPHIDPRLQTSFRDRAEELVVLRARQREEIQTFLTKMKQSDKVSWPKFLGQCRYS